ncbi:MAG: cache domain-containing protein, partial [Desulfobulbus sp.]|nr:cache domain-containing protein [Desulfobulbus sp.]
MTSVPQHIPAIKTPPQRSRLSLRKTLIATLLALAVLAVCGYNLDQYQKQTILREQSETLRSISRLKINHIQTWRQERMIDARLNSSGLLKLMAQQWQKQPTPDLLEMMKARMQFLQENMNYSDMILADPSGNIVASLLPRPAGLELQEQNLVAQVIASKSAKIGEFFQCLYNCDHIHLPVAAPILDQHQDQVLMVLILIADPYFDLYPIIQTWPTADHSGEIMLIRKDGDDLLVLNQLRHRDDPPLSFRQPLATTHTLAAHSLQGATGTMQGLDYRGVEVLAVLDKVPDTDWVLVTKTDTHALLAEAHYRTMAILLLVSMTTVLAGILMRLVGLARHKSLLEALLQEEQEHQKTRGEILATLYSIG